MVTWPDADSVVVDVVVGLAVNGVVALETLRSIAVKPDVGDAVVAVLEMLRPMVNSSKVSGNKPRAGRELLIKFQQMLVCSSLHKLRNSRHTILAEVTVQHEMGAGLLVLQICNARAIQAPCKCQRVHPSNLILIEQSTHMYELGDQQLDHRQIVQADQI